MSYVTDRKRAMGLGSGHRGTERHWAMTMSSTALVLLVPLFLIVIAPAIGADHAAVAAHFARPLPAIVTGLMLVVGLHHFRQGVQMAIEDYTSGSTRHLTIIASACLAYGAMATGIFALVRLAL